MNEKIKLLKIMKKVVEIGEPKDATPRDIRKWHEQLIEEAGGKK